MESCRILFISEKGRYGRQGSDRSVRYVNPVDEEFESFGESRRAAVVLGERRHDARVLRQESGVHASRLSNKTNAKRAARGCVRERGRKKEKKEKKKK